MTRTILLLTSLLVNSFLFGHTPSDEFKRDFIAQHARIAQLEMERTGIPASIKLAQGCLESDWGRGELALSANNYFGIKCKDGDEGPCYPKMDDDLDENKQLMLSYFRMYDDALSSWYDHSEFLVNRGFYDQLFLLDPTDYVAWAHGLKAAGYATDSAYAYKLIALIENYDLHQYDTPIRREQLVETLPEPALPMHFVVPNQMGEVIISALDANSRRMFNAYELKRRRRLNSSYANQSSKNNTTGIQNAQIEAFQKATSASQLGPLAIPESAPGTPPPVPGQEEQTKAEPLPPSKEQIRYTRRMKRRAHLPQGD